MSNDFSSEQKRYLEGFMSGMQSVRALKEAAPPLRSAGYYGPDRPHLEAQDRVIQSGRKLAEQETWKRTENPLDACSRLKASSRKGLYPKPDDNFRWRYHGLFYVAPTQSSFMCRLRIPNGILSNWQLLAVANIAERFGGGYSHITTRANLQIREIKAEIAGDVVDALSAVGLSPRGSGADNIRNVTGSATAGIDAQELIDTRPQALDWHFHILNERILYGLPRKFNVSFDGGGSIATLEDTNDIGFQAVRVLEDASVPSGVYYRLTLGGITGHRDLARDTGIVVLPSDTTSVADAIVRVFIDHGDRTNRNRARLKYLLDEWGFDRFLTAVEEKLGRPLSRVNSIHVAPRPLHDRRSHVGVHPQRQNGLNWVGVWTPLGKMTCDQMRAIADIAGRLGDGDVRLTVWQNLLISGVQDAGVEHVLQQIAAAGLTTKVSPARAGLVACTGNSGCKFAASDTKRHALEIADHIDATLSLDSPVNIHLTGCHHSCAQHYIGDIGLIATKVAAGNEEQVEGYHIHAGGGFATQGAIGKLIWSDVSATMAPRVVEALLRAYLKHRCSPEEPFHTFAASRDPEELRRLAEEALT